MNFITFMPYCFNNTPFANQFLAPQPNPKNNSILICLSQALNTSLLKYQNQILSQKQTPKQPSQPEAKKVQPKQSKKHVQTPKEEQKLRKSEPKVSEKENIKQKVIEIIQKSQKPSKQTVQTIKSQVQLQKLEKSESAIKIREHYHRIKKDKTKQKKSSQLSKNIEICLLDAAVCLPMGMSKELLRRKREKLLRRQVFDWNQKSNSLREKRQLRMLH